MENRLFVGGLPWATDDDELRTAFERFGKISDASIIKDRDTGRSRGFGFVTFADDDAARNAVEAMDGAEVGGRRISVRTAQDRAPREGGGGGFREDRPRPSGPNEAWTRPPSDRPPVDRGYPDRAPSDRPPVDRSYPDRAPSDRPHTDRPYPDRAPSDRPPRQEWSSDRRPSERPVAPRPDRPYGDRPRPFPADRPYSNDPSPRRFGGDSEWGGGRSSRPEPWADTPPETGWVDDSSDRRRMRMEKEKTRRRRDDNDDD